MKKIILTIFLIFIGYEFLFPYFGKVQHVFAEKVVIGVSHIRGSNRLTNQGTANDILSFFHQNPYLSPSMLITSDDKEITALAHQITEGKQKDTDKSKAVYSWVAHHITYDLSELSSDFFLYHYRYHTASEVLNSGKGICIDFATLNAALHRAAGIPAKVVYGGDHAWNEIELNGKWIPQDPTFGSGYVYMPTDKFVKAYDTKYFNHADVKKTGEFEW